MSVTKLPQLGIADLLHLVILYFVGTPALPEIKVHSLHPPPDQFRCLAVLQSVTPEHILLLEPLLVQESVLTCGSPGQEQRLRLLAGCTQNFRILVCLLQSPGS